MGRWWVGGEKQGGRRLSQTPPGPRSLSSLPRSRSMKSAAPPSMAALPGRALPLRPVLPLASPMAPCVSCSAHHHCPCTLPHPAAPALTPGLISSGKPLFPQARRQAPVLKGTWGGCHGP